MISTEYASSGRRPVSFSHRLVREKTSSGPVTSRIWMSGYASIATRSGALDFAMGKGCPSGGLSTMTLFPRIRPTAGDGRRGGSGGIRVAQRGEPLLLARQHGNDVAGQQPGDPEGDERERLAPEREERPQPGGQRPVREHVTADREDREGHHDRAREVHDGPVSPLRVTLFSCSPEEPVAEEDQDREHRRRGQVVIALRASRPAVAIAGEKDDADRRHRRDLAEDHLALRPAVVPEKEGRDRKQKSDEDALRRPRLVVRRADRRDLVPREGPREKRQGERDDAHDELDRPVIDLRACRCREQRRLSRRGSYSSRISARPTG